jgi:hypothetical protein
MPAKAEFDPSALRREAAMFYGLFLRGHSAELLRRDIDVPSRLVQKWLRSPAYESSFREHVRRAYRFRKQVLAIFEDLVSRERAPIRIQ